MSNDYNMGNTKESRSAAAASSWKSRPPAYLPNKTITLRPRVWETLDRMRGERTWAAFLCGLAGITPPRDGRRSAN